MRKLMTGAALAAAALTILPSQALAGGKKHGHHKHRHHYSHYQPDYRYAPAPVYREQYVQRVYERRDRCRSGTTGAIVGAAAGALLGREIDGGRDRAQGTIIGGAAGALLGREATRDC